MNYEKYFTLCMNSVQSAQNIGENIVDVPCGHSNPPEFNPVDIMNKLKATCNTLTGAVLITDINNKNYIRITWR